MSNSKYRNAMERLIAYRAYSSAYNVNTIFSLSSSLDIPISVARKDIIKLNSSKALSVFFQLEDIDWNDDLQKDFVDAILGKSRSKYCNNDLSDVLEQKITSIGEGLSLLISDGVFDNIPFEIIDNASDPYEDLMNDDIYVPVNYDEYLAYKNLFEQHVFPKVPAKEVSFVTSTIRNKKYVCDFGYDILEKLDAIEQAIKAGKTIKFLYKPISEAAETIHVKPVKIGFDATESRYVLISARNNRIKTYELDFMIGNITIAPDLNDKIDSSLLSLADKVWGFEYYKCIDEKGHILPPIRVKLCFYDEANVINKARRDLAFRNPISLNIDDNGNLIYEDDVYGVDSFLSWVFTFGSSVKVLAPDMLVSKILKKITDKTPDL